MAQYNASERKHIREAEKAQKLSELQQLSAVRGIMSVADGRTWMYELLADCCVFHTPYTGDDAATNFNCGKQSVGLRLLSQIMQASPDDYILMMREANDRRSAGDRRRDEGSGRDDNRTDPDRDENPGNPTAITDDRPDEGYGNQDR